MHKRRRCIPVPAFAGRGSCSCREHHVTALPPPDHSRRFLLNRHGLRAFEANILNLLFKTVSSIRSPKTLPSIHFFIPSLLLILPHRAYDDVQHTFDAPETEDTQQRRLLEWCHFYFSPSLHSNNANDARFFLPTLFNSCARESFPSAH